MRSPNGFAVQYSQLTQVEAVVVAGSYSANQADPNSDLDIYVYTRSAVPLNVRSQIATEQASLAEVDNCFWEPGDEWIDAETEIRLDVMFRSTEWIEDQLDRVLQQHKASIGYSTCFWHNVLTAKILYDCNDWYHHLQQGVW